MLFIAQLFGFVNHGAYTPYRAPGRRHEALLREAIQREPNLCKAAPVLHFVLPRRFACLSSFRFCPSGPGPESPQIGLGETLDFRRACWPCFGFVAVFRPRTLTVYGGLLGGCRAPPDPLGDLPPKPPREGVGRFAFKEIRFKRSTGVV